MKIPSLAISYLSGLEPLERYKLVADPANCSDQNGTPGIALNFLAQVGDAVIDGPIRGTLSFRPRRGNEFLA